MNIQNVTAAGIETASSAAASGGPPADSARDQGRTESAARQALSDQQIKKMISEIQERLGAMNISINFSRYGEKNENIAITVSDKVTGEVIREIPPKEIQQLYMKMNELIGLIFNGSV